MGMFFYTDAFRMFPLDPFKETHDYSYIGIYADRVMKEDTLEISAWDAKTKFESRQYVYLEDAKHLRLMHTGTGKKYWANFQKKELNLAAILKIIDAVDDFSLVGPNMIFEHLDEFEELTEIPEADRRILLPMNGIYGFFQYQVNHDNSIFRIRKAYKFKDTYIIWTYRMYTSGYGNYERIFIIRPARYKEGTYLLESVSLRNYQGDFMYSDRQLILTKQQSMRCTELDHRFDIKDLPDVFFEDYYDTRQLFKSWSFPRSFKLNRNGEIEIAGKTYHFVRIYSSRYDPGHEKKRELTKHTRIFLEVKNPETHQHKILKLEGTPEGELQIPFGVGGTFYTFTSAKGIIKDLLLKLAILILIILVIGFFVYRSILLPRKLKQRLSQSQLEGIKAQLNPHFLFNSMASIQSLMNQNKIQEANTYQSELSDLLRYNLDTGAEDMVLLSEELSALQHYLKLENLRTPFPFSFEVDMEIDPDSTEIPNQLLQPLVENAIKHGLRYSEEPYLIIRIQKRDKRMFIHILDNGPGISSLSTGQEELPTLRKTHKGLSLLKEKMSILSKKGFKVKLQVADRMQDLGHEETGTQASLEIPLKY